jgi:hypothetical protein
MIAKMISRRIGCNLALLAVLGVVTVFLFPAVQGPYSAVHGPVTALQAARAAARMHGAIVQAALQRAGSHRVSPLDVLPFLSVAKAEFNSAGLVDNCTILRC